METNRLKVFIDLSQTLNFSKTAENLFITQSDVSKQIRSLEKELGVTLFIRNNKHVKLSTIGKAILPNAKEIITQEHQLKEKLKTLQKGKNEVIKIASIPTFSNYIPVTLLSKYMDCHPKIDIQLKEVESSQIDNLLRNKQVDFAFMRSFTNKPINSSILIKKEKFALCVAQDDPLAKKNWLNLSNLKNKSFIMLSKNSMLYQPVINLCQKAGFNPKVIFISERISSIKYMIKNHQGISLLMNSGEKSPGLKFVPIKPTIKSYLYFLKRRGKLTYNEQNFWHYLKAIFNSKTE